ncbi:hypothetical protein EV421DRAFT_1370429 [Armillaria borealis]|uniref:Uncharacterized protein n=1 Tax=Armillaria borealis TaxID=47425 RepID=A0AA39MHD2_9AGAR|nr:hypothetical protein EV421DRAFT_1370429 [Armillaria borealis]
MRTKNLKRAWWYHFDNGSLHEIRSIKADLHPVNITGDVMAVATSPRRSSTIVRPTDVPTSTTLATTCTIITSKLSSYRPLSSSSAPAPSFFTPPPSPTSRHTPLDSQWSQCDTDLHPHLFQERQSLGIRAKLTRALLAVLLSSNSCIQNIVSARSPSMHRHYPRQAGDRRMDLSTRPHQSHCKHRGGSFQTWIKISIQTASILCIQASITSGLHHLAKRYVSPLIPGLR